MSFLPFKGRIKVGMGLYPDCPAAAMAKLCAGFSLDVCSQYARDNHCVDAIFSGQPDPRGDDMVLMGRGCGLSAGFSHCRPLSSGYHGLNISIGQTVDEVKDGDEFVSGILNNTYFLMKGEKEM
jgi:hypothetical protein